jgi:hypothetical protein
MVGVICKWEIVRHPLVTIECFGWLVFVRAVFAGRDQTFLSLLGQAGTFGAPETPLTECINRCIDLERRAMRIYRSLATRYEGRREMREFFDHLAAQEATHAELLTLCRVAAGRGRRHDQAVDHWLCVVPETERRLAAAEEMVERHAAADEALRLVLQMESSQINGLFANVVRLSASRLARRFHAFQTAVYEHLAYIRQQIPTLEPALGPECDRLPVTC